MFSYQFSTARTRTSVRVTSFRLGGIDRRIYPRPLPRPWNPSWNQTSDQTNHLCGLANGKVQPAKNN